MAKATPQGKQYETGYPFVVGPKAVFLGYIGKPWAAVLASAETGTDGLKVVTGDTPRAEAGHFALRELKGRAYGPVPVAGLFEQRW